jgi:membrane-associated phospholipid phosphatase
MTRGHHTSRIGAGQARDSSGEAAEPPAIAAPPTTSPLESIMSYRFPSRVLAPIVALALSIGACSDAPPTSALQREPFSASPVDVREPGSSVYWNQAARELLVAYHPFYFNPFLQTRLFAYLSIAQYNAIVAAEGAKERGDHPSIEAAVAAASVAVLRSFLVSPQAHAAIDARLQAQLGGAPAPGQQHQDVDEGLTIGQAVGAAVIAYAASDGFGQTAAPVNTGSWRGTNSVIGLYGTRLLVLQSEDQFRPAPPPTLGSAEFSAAIDELLGIVMNRTPEQIQSAYDWASRNNAAMNEVATNLIVAHHRTEREAARILAVANMAGFDVAHACFDAKFSYYYIRPSQFDAAITQLPGLGVPNHPSYPSGHSCIVSAYATVLASEFPSERRELEAMVEAAGMSRMYAGFHYRFDLAAGQELGRQVARYVLEHGVDRKSAIPLD